ncbi:hypothetical protein PJI17_28225 [Mycobacterium kansasii]
MRSSQTIGIEPTVSLRRRGVGGFGEIPAVCRYIAVAARLCRPVDTVLAEQQSAATAGAGAAGRGARAAVADVVHQGGRLPGLGGGGSASCAGGRRSGRAGGGRAATGWRPGGLRAGNGRGAGDGGGDAVARYGTSTWWSPSRFRWLSPAWRGPAHGRGRPTRSEFPIP